MPETDVPQRSIESLKESLVALDRELSEKEAEKKARVKALNDDIRDIKEERESIMEQIITLESRNSE